jgi:hypothetical protein
VDELLSNPRGIFILCCVGALVFGLNMTLVGVLRGDKRFQREASKWTQAFGGGRDVRRKENADAAELHRLVQEIKDKGLEGQSPKHDE